MPGNVRDIFSKYRKIAVAEINLGQFADYLRMKYRIQLFPINKVQGLPFTIQEIKEKCIKILEEK